MCKGGFPSDGYSFARLFDYLHTFGANIQTIFIPPYDWCGFVRIIILF